MFKSAVLLSAAALMTPVVAHAGATLQAVGGATSFGAPGDASTASAAGDSWTAAARHAGPWNAAGALLGGAAALPETAPGAAGYRYTLVTPITLAAGQPNVAADRTSASDGDASVVAAFGLATAGETVFGAATAAAGPRLPVGTTSGSPISGKFTFRTIASRLPEPATWILMILGFGAIGGLMRYQIRRSEARFTAKLRRIAAGETA